MHGEAVLDALAAQHTELGTILDGLAPGDWHRPSPCEGWDVADVVLHLAQTDELALASATGRFADALAAFAEGTGPAGDVDEGAARLVERDRHAGPAAIHERWRSAATSLRVALAGADPSTRVEWVAGQLSVRTLATTRLAECWIHTTDVAAAVGRAPEATDRLAHIARLAWRTLPYAFARAGRPAPGPVAFELTGPAGEAWTFAPDEPPRTVIRGDALELCLVAGRRRDPAATGLTGEGPDAGEVLALVRTYA